MPKTTVLTNAEIITMSGPGSMAGEIAFCKGRIEAVGKRVPGELRTHARIIDMQGAVIVPAFIDSHLHWIGAGLLLIGLRLDDAENHDDLKSTLLDSRKERGKGDWIVGMGAADNSMPEARLPTREEIDAWIDDSPVVIVRADGHGCVANSRALQELSLPSGINGLDAKSGYLVGDAQTEAIKRGQSVIARRHLLTALRAISAQALSNGVGTAVCMEGFGMPLEIDVHAVRLAGLLRRPRLKIFFQTLDVNKAVKHRCSRIGGCFEVSLDGSFSSHTAAMFKPFNDQRNNSGLLYHSDETIRSFIERAHLAGRQIAMHAIGDRAIEQALSAYEYVLSRHPAADHRHRIEHAEIPLPEQIERMVKIGLHLAVQPAFLDMPTTPPSYMRHILGARRYKGYLPLKSYVSAGADISGGSDAPVSPINPLRGIHMAVNHPNESQALSPYEALRIFTRGGARSVFEERCRGTLEPGLDADLTVLDRNPLTAPKESIDSIRVLSMYIGGKLAYSAPRSDTNTS